MQLNRDKQIVYANEVANELFGYAYQELMGQDIENLYSKLHLPSHFKRIWDNLKSNSTWTGELCLRSHSDRQLWLMCSIAAFAQEGKDGYLLVAFDISKEKEAQYKLLHRSRLVSIGEMAGGIAHEINSPLAAAQLFVERLLEMVKARSHSTIDWDIEFGKLSATIKRIGEIVKTMRRLVGQHGPLPKVTSSLVEIINDTVFLCRERFDRTGIELSLELDRDCLLLCRPSEIGQVILNLLNNSFTSVMNLTDRWVRIKTQVERGAVNIFIVDSGNGIDPNIAMNIMKPFFTTASADKSNMGLGLSISKQIITDHGGQMRYEDKSVNTTFVVSLPTVENQQ